MEMKAKPLSSSNPEPFATAYTSHSHCHHLPSSCAGHCPTDLTAKQEVWKVIGTVTHVMWCSKDLKSSCWTAQVCSVDCEIHFSSLVYAWTYTRDFVQKQWPPPPAQIYSQNPLHNVESMTTRFRRSSTWWCLLCA